MASVYLFSKHNVYFFNFVCIFTPYLLFVYTYRFVFILYFIHGWINLIRNNFVLWIEDKKSHALMVHPVLSAVLTSQVSCLYN